MKPTFTTPCFIRKNTPDLRRKLEELGRKRSITFDDSQKFIWTTETYYYSTNNFVIGCSYGERVLPYGINCGDNEALFLAIAALMEDSDYMQWFVTDEEHHWVNQGMYMPKGSFIQSFVKDFPKDNSHKASVEELIEHFKKD